MIGVVTSSVWSAWATAGSTLVEPSSKVCRSLCLSILSRLVRGTLEINDHDGVVHRLGGIEKPELKCVLHVHNPRFWIRLAVFADMGFAESYLLSEVSASPLTNFFTIFILNRPYLAGSTSTLTASIASSVAGFLRATNTLANARLHIAAHYDISNAMFASFLSPDMTYSCALWRKTSDPLHAAESLEEAQDRKLARVVRAAKLKRGDRVLEIGTGWGSFAIKAVRETGCKVVSLTLSGEQKKLADERIRDAGLENEIEVRLCDYRALKAPPEGGFDKIVSIEMLEAVGREYLDTYFACVDRLLKKDGGIAVFQCITISEFRYDAYSKSDDFIRRYIFPGGHLPSVSQLVKSIEAGSSGTLVVDDIKNIGPHYAKTLRIWGENFEREFDDQIKPALLREHEEMTKEDVEVFRRKWMYYFTYCEAAFATKTLGDVQITVGREGAVEMMEEVPL